MPGPNPFKPPRPRPINPLDNPATTGLLSNPNGTYIANPFPTTAAIGGTGAYGSMLPQVNVGQTWIQQAASRVTTPATTTPAIRLPLPSPTAGMVNQGL